VGSQVLSTSSGAKTAAVSSVTSLVESSRTSVLETALVDTTGQEMTASQIYAANVNSCVGITANITYNVWGYTTTAAASGSGFVLTSDGYIATNYHVVEDSDSDGLTVTMYDGTSYAATLVGYDSDNDVAVLKIDAEGLTPVVIGDSDSLSVGDEVVAIGNPLGELTFSLTDGVVSALNREVTLSTGTMNLIQTDCAINSGNSGGPLFNSYGEVVGITNAKYSSSGSSSEASIDNIGFAIPSNTFQSIVESIIENGYVVKPYMGVSLQDYSYTNDDGTTTSGALIYSVESGTAAETAGLTRGDLITAINGETVSSASDATTIVSQCQAGDAITVTIDRSGESMDVALTLGERTQDATADSSSSATQQQEQSQQGGQYYQYGYGNGQYGSSGTNPYSYYFGNGVG
jgi:serine protease Do